MQLNAYMNWGRWLITCPRCGTPLPAWESGVVCPQCYPGIFAKALQKLPNGLFRPVADIELVEQTKQTARQANEEYLPRFPFERTQIEKILRLRPAPKHMNWIPGETLDDLRQQNIDHGDPVPDELNSPRSNGQGKP